MAREYNGTSNKARISIRNKARPVEGGAVGHSKMTPFEAKQKLNAEKEEIIEGPRATPAEYDKDYLNRGYYPVRPGETRVLEPLGSHREPMLDQLTRANRNKK